MQGRSLPNIVINSLLISVLLIFSHLALAQVPVPIAQWQLDETSGVNADDAIDANNGLLINFPTDNSQWVDGTLDNALDFDGADDYVSIVEPDIGAGPFSLSAWVYVDSFANTDDSGMGIIRSHSDGNIGDYHLAITKSGRVDFYNWRIASGNDPTGKHITATGVIALNTWQHVLVTWDGTVNKIYVDGNPVSIESTTLTGTGWGTGHELGRANYDSVFKAGVADDYIFNGKLDDVRVYNQALNSTEVSNIYYQDSDADGMPDEWEWAHGFNIYDGNINADADTDGLTNLEEYQQGTDPLDSDSDNDGVLDGEDLYPLDNTQAFTPVAHWALDETSGMVAADSVGNNDGVLEHFTEDGWTPGIINGGLQFDGFDDAVTITDPALGTGPFSIEAWVYIDNLSIVGDGMHTIIWSITGNTVGDYWLYIAADGSANFLNWRTASSSDPTGWHYTSASAISEQRWHHIAAVWDGVSNKIYVDGVEQSLSTQTTFVGGLIGEHRGYPDHRIGYPNSILDFLSAFGGILDEVKLYNKALTHTLINNADTDGDGVSDFQDYAPGDPNYSVWLDTDSDGIHDAHDADDDNDGAVDEEDLYPLDNTRAFDPVAHWALDEADGSTVAVDSAGNNDGVLEHFTEDGWTPGIINGGLQFDGGDDAITIADPALRDGAFSVEAWVYINDLDYDYTIIRSITGDTAGDYWLTAGYRGRVNFYHWRTSSGLDLNGWHRTSDYVITAQGWHHIAVVWDGGINKIYINGIEQALTTITTEIYEGLDGRYFTGHHIGYLTEYLSFPFNNYEGILDEVKLYDKALTQSLIINNGNSRDSDGDGVSDFQDYAPGNPDEWEDLDNDGYGDNLADAFPGNPDEWADIDGDGYGDNLADAFPNDPTQWLDTDGDGYGDTIDVEPNNPNVWSEKVYSFTGEFNVTASGAATYSIPIAVPPGIAGLSPKLSLQFNSQARNSTLGEAWSLSGLSIIHRCNATKAQDNYVDGIEFDGNDKYCLDGTRLIDIGSNQYRTEIDGFSRITRIGGTSADPDYFKVETKTGEIMYYGNTANSNIQAQGRSEAYAWALNRVEDRYGNTMIYEYTENTNFSEFRIHRINYAYSGGSSYAHVEFQYDQNRSDAVLGYMSGAQIKVNGLLEKILTYSQGNLVKEYRLNYAPSFTTGRNRLQDVTECAGNGQCLLPIKVNWSFSLVDSDYQSWGHKQQHYVAYNGTHWPIDVNSDGRTDLVYHRNNTNEYYALVSQPDGSMQPQSSAWGVKDHHVVGFYGTHWPLDVNGDGLMDLVHNKSSSTEYYVFINKGDGTTNFQPWGTRTGGGTSDTKHWAMDINADGIDDLVYYTSSGLHAFVGHSDGSSSQQAINGFTGAGIGDRSWLLDVNADGLMDLVYYYYSLSNPNHHYRVVINNGDGSVTVQDWASHANNIGIDGTHYPMDINGDGLVDLAYSRAGSLHYGVLINKGNGTAFEQYWTTRTHGAGYGYAHWPMDVNADGMTDLIYNRANTDEYWAIVSNPDGTYTDNFWEDKNGTDVAWDRHFQADIDGDGDLELIHHRNNSNEYLVFRNQTERDRVISIIDNLGNSTVLSYASLVDDSVYDPVYNNYYSSSAGYPSPVLTAPLYVVKNMMISDGIGGTRDVDYFYKTLRVNRLGRGSLGFAEVRSTDDRGLVKTTSYSQSFPLIGLPLVTTELGVTTTNQYAYFNTANSADGSVPAVFPYPQKTTEVVSHLNNSLTQTLATTTVETTNAYDGWGNPIQVSVKTTGDSHEYKAVTNNIYYPADTANWLLSRLQQATVTHFVDNNTDVTSTRTTAFTYYSTGLLQSETVEPGRGAPYELTTTYGRDSVGNIISTTTSGPGISSRTETTSYDSRGQFIRQVVNAELEAENRTYEPQFGNLVKITGPNNITTCWDFDEFGYKTRERNLCNSVAETQTSWVYAWDSSLPHSKYKLTTQAPGMPASVSYYNSLGRELRRQKTGFDGSLIYQDTHYDAIGRVIENTEPYYAGDDQYKTMTSYDNLGRILQVEFPDGYGGYKITTTTYNGFSSTITDAANRTSTETKNAIGQTMSVTDQMGYTTSYRYTTRGDLHKTILPYTYDSAGNLIANTETGSNTTVIEYDLLGRKIAMQDANMGNWSYSYNVLGELISQTDAEGKVTTMEYDKVGRLVKRTDDATGTPHISQWVYGSDANQKNVGKLVSESGPNGTAKSYQYDVNGRLATQTYHIATNSYTVARNYDSLGRLDTLTYPSSATYSNGFKVKRQYNNYGYLSAVESANGGTPTTYWQANYLNAKDQIETDTLGSGIYTHRVYNQANGWLLSTDVQDLNADLILHADYNFDPLTGNLQSRSLQRPNIATVSESFTYDNLDRLTSSQVAGQALKQYSYDPLGNITSKAGVGNYTYGTCGAGPNAVCQAGGNAYSYDANGNMTFSNGRSVNYTLFNKPQQFIADAGSTIVSFIYGADRSRLLKTAATDTKHTETAYVGLGATGGTLYERQLDTNSGDIEHTFFIYAAGGQPIARHVETDPASGAAVTKTEYFHRDHLGSLEAITDELGAVVIYKSHDSWGLRRNATDWTDDASQAYVDENGHLCFTGHESITEVGLIHMNGRVYDPVLGRFMSADPNVQFEKDSQSYNRYSYVRNNPLKYTDPSGYFLKKLFRKISPQLAQVITVALNFVPGVGPVLSAMFSAIYASANGASIGQAAMSFVLSFVAGKVGQTGAGAIKGLEGYTKYVVQGAIAGGFSGGVNAAINDTSIGEGILRGAANGAAMAAINWNTPNNPARKAYEQSKFELEQRHAQQASQEANPSQPDSKGGVIAAGESGPNQAGQTFEDRQRIVNTAINDVNNLIESGAVSRPFNSRNFDIGDLTVEYHDETGFFPRTEIEVNALATVVTRDGQILGGRIDIYKSAATSIDQAVKTYAHELRHFSKLNQRLGGPLGTISPTQEFHADRYGNKVYEAWKNR